MIPFRDKNLAGAMFRSRAWFASLVFSCFFASANAALAAEKAPTEGKSFDDTLLVTRGHFGFGTPVGIFGASAELSGLRYLAVQLGVGHNGVGPQLALTGFGRLPLGDGFGVDVGAGLSGGAYEYRSNWLDADHSDDTRWDTAVFLNAELALETLARSGFSTRWSFGLGRLLNPDDVSECTSGGDRLSTCPDSRKQGHTVPYVGMALGYAFSL